MQQRLQDDQCVDAGAQIVHHDPGSFRQPLEAAHRWRLHDVKRSEKYKAREQRLPHEGTGNQRHQLPRDFVDHHMGRIFLAASASFQGRRRYSDCDCYYD